MHSLVGHIVVSKKDKNLIKLALALFLLQIADGICTYVGVTNFGVAVEGNPLIKYLITLTGAAVALISVKASTLIPIYLLTKAKAEKILIFLVGLYIGVVLQWLISLYEHL